MAAARMLPPISLTTPQIIAPGSQTTLAQLGLPESFTPARYRLRSRMFPAEQEGEYEPVKIRKREKPARPAQDDAIPNGDPTHEEPECEWIVASICSCHN